MAPTKDVTTTDTAEISVLGEKLRGLIEAVPQVQSTDAQARIVEQILSAKTVGELDAPWSAGAAGLGDYNGQSVTIHSIRRAPSSFPGMGIFLILDLEDQNGERHVVTTGSVSVVVQLMKAYELNAYPLRCTPNVSERASANGYYPQHLSF